MNWRLFSQILARVFRLKPNPRRLELRYVNYKEGDRLVREGWTIAPEEDNNRSIGMVYLERLEPHNIEHEAGAERR